MVGGEGSYLCSVNVTQRCSFQFAGPVNDHAREWSKYSTVFKFVFFPMFIISVSLQKCICMCLITKLGGGGGHILEMSEICPYSIL